MKTALAISFVINMLFWSQLSFGTESYPIELAEAAVEVIVADIME